MDLVTVARVALCVVLSLASIVVAIVAWRSRRRRWQGFTGQVDGELESARLAPTPGSSHAERVARVRAAVGEVPVVGPWLRSELPGGDIKKLPFRER